MINKQNYNCHGYEEYRYISINSKTCKIKKYKDVKGCFIFFFFLVKVWIRQDRAPTFPHPRMFPLILKKNNLYHFMYLTPPSYNRLKSKLIKFTVHSWHFLFRFVSKIYFFLKCLEKEVGVHGPYMIYVRYIASWI